LEHSTDLRKVDVISSAEKEQLQAADQVFRLAFMAKYRSFCSPSILLEGLKRRWQHADRLLAGPANCSPTVLADRTMLVRSNILRVVDIWTVHQFEDFLDDDSLMESFSRCHSQLILKEPSPT